MKKILIIPAYNEEDTIGDVILEAKKYIKNIIVIDDGSTDNTVKVSKKCGARVILHTKNKGLGKAIRTGYNAALKAKADIIIQTDADGQYSLKDIPNLIEPIINNQADMVIGSRFKGGIEKMPFQKIIGNKIGTYVTRMVSGFKTTDAQSGYRAMRKELIQEIKPTHQMTYVQEMIIRASKEHWRIMEIPSYFKVRKGDGKSRLIASLPKYAKNAFIIIIRTVIDYHSLSFFGIPGLFLFLIGIAIAINPISWFLQNQSVTPIIGTTLLSVFFMISGILLVSIGLITDLIARKTKEIKLMIRDK